MAGLLLTQSSTDKLLGSATFTVRAGQRSRGCRRPTSGRWGINIYQLLSDLDDSKWQCQHLTPMVLYRCPACKKALP
jgi:hypothetical protein